MSYSPARIDEPVKTEGPAAPEQAQSAATQAPLPNAPTWFGDGFDQDQSLSAADRYRERLARHAEMQRRETEEMEQYRRRLDEKFALAKRLYDKPAAGPLNDNLHDQIMPNEPAKAEQPRNEFELTWPETARPRSRETAFNAIELSAPAARTREVQPDAAQFDSMHPAAAAEAARLPIGSSSAAPMLRARRPTVPLSEIEKRKKKYASKETREAKARRTPKRNTSNLRYYAAAAAFSIIVGAGAGYGLSNRVNLLNTSQASLQKAQNWLAALTTRAPETAPPVVLASAGGSSSVKPITAARLAVNDVRGTLNSMIPLALTATPASSDQPVDLEISGLPQSAYLTAGKQKEDGRWLVQATDIPDLKLVIPQSETPKIDLQVAAVEQTSGSLAAPAQKMSVELSDVKILPASAPPEGQPDPLALKPAAAPDATQVGAIPAPTSAAGGDLLARADGLMNQGDILSARQYYMQASAAGNPRGTLGVARTYDPKVFVEMKIEGLRPDAAKAAEWYKKAQGEGLTAQQ